MTEFPKSRIYDKTKNLNLPPESVVIVGRAAIEAIVGPDKCAAEKLELVADEERFRALWQQDGFERIETAQGMQLANDEVTVYENWNGRTHEQLARRGYEHNGVPVAGLPDVYEYNQDVGTAEGNANVAAIQERLYSPLTLPSEVTAKELAFVQSQLPEYLQGRPELEVAANGLYVVRTVFGDGSESGARQYSGETEAGAVSTQHAWEHSAFGVKAGQANIEALNARKQASGEPVVFTDDDRVNAAIAYANHDVILGHGRQSVNPTGHDERRSADHVASQMERFDSVSDQGVEAVHAAVMATTYNEETSQQDVRPERGHVPLQELTAGTDLSIFRTPLAVSNSTDLVVEDMTRSGATYDRPLARLVEDLNANRPEDEPPVQIKTTEDGLRLIDQYPDYPATRTVGGETQEMTLKEAAIARMEGSVGFFKAYKAPGEWATGDPDMPQKNAEDLKTMADEVKAGKSIEEVHKERLEYEKSQNHPAAVGKFSSEKETPDSSTPLPMAPEKKKATPSEPAKAATTDTSVQDLKDKMGVLREKTPLSQLEIAKQQLEEAVSAMSEVLQGVGAPEVSQAVGMLQEAQAELQALSGTLNTINETLRSIANNS